MEQHLLAYYLAIASLFSHSLILIATNHNILNLSYRVHGMIMLVNILAIAYYFMHKEKMIEF